MAAKKLKVTLIKSTIGVGRKHQACVLGLGLRRIRHSVEIQDTPEIRGMIHKVRHMLKCEEI